MNSISLTLFVFWLEQHPKDFKLSNRIGCLLKMGNFLSEVTGVSVNTGGTTWLPVHRLHFTFYCFMNLTMLLTDQKMKQMSLHTLSLLSHDSAMLLSDGMCQFMAPCWGAEGNGID